MNPRLLLCLVASLVGAWSTIHAQGNVLGHTHPASWEALLSLPILPALPPLPLPSSRSLPLLSLP